LIDLLGKKKPKEGEINVDKLIKISGSIYNLTSKY
jgi:hypothetical protein